MFRLFYCCAFLCLFCAAASPADAHLYFLPDYKDAVLFGTNIPHNPGTVENTCPDLGYNVTSCPAGYYLSGKCPLSALYYKECLPIRNLCTDKGYVSSCPVGEIPDLSDVCPEDENYFTCKCDPCEGYDYTYAQATVSGYVVDGSGCQSCDEMKYKRKPAPCIGYNYDETNCNVTSCGNLEGGSCRSGNVTKYEKCTPCPVVCPAGKVNIDTYWCDSALRCLLPEE